MMARRSKTAAATTPLNDSLAAVHMGLLAAHSSDFAASSRAMAYIIGVLEKKQL